MWNSQKFSQIIGIEKIPKPTSSSFFRAQSYKRGENFPQPTREAGHANSQAMLMCTSKRKPMGTRIREHLHFPSACGTPNNWKDGDMRPLFHVRHFGPGGHPRPPKTGTSRPPKSFKGLDHLHMIWWLELRGKTPLKGRVLWVFFFF